jgi:5-methylcytosine-specific restriction endonuclease McrA
MSFEVDEIVPVSRGGNPLDFDNTQPAHRICNQKKGNKMTPSGDRPALLPKSRDW